MPREVKTPARGHTAEKGQRPLGACLKGQQFSPRDPRSPGDRTRGGWRQRASLYTWVPAKSWLLSQRLEAPPCPGPTFSEALLEFSLGQKPEARWEAAFLLG